MEEVKVSEVQDMSVIYSQDKAVIDTQIATAKAYPRNLKKSVDNAVFIVTLDEETASTCSYSLPRAGKVITGPTVHFAKILAQNWGNLRIEAKVITIDRTTLTSQAVAFDLENNLAIKVEVKRSIMTKTGRMNDDMITVTGNAANAISMRNAILNVIPKGVVDKVYNEAKNKITGDLSDDTKLALKRKKVFDGFKTTYDVLEQEVLQAIGKAAIEHITQDDLVVLIGIGQAIKDGDTTVDLAFRPKKTNALKQVNLEPIDVKTTKDFENKLNSTTGKLDFE